MPDQSDPRPIPPQGSKPPPPAAGKPAEPEPAGEAPGTANGLPSGMFAPNENPAPTLDPANIERAIAALGASVEGMAVELALVRKRQAKVERQLILLCGVATYILWRVAKPKLPSMKGGDSLVDSESIPGA